MLARHAGVKDAAVIGEPDEKWGERVVAVAGRRGAHGRDPRSPLPDERRPRQLKRPRQFVFVTAIPKTASGKILRRLLRDGQYTEVRP